MRLIANNGVAVTNGPMGLAGIGQSGVTGKTSFYFIALCLAALALYLSFRFVHSNAGRAAVAVRENRYVAQSIGVDPFGTAMQAFVLGDFLAGVAGGFYAHSIPFVGPEVLQLAFTVDRTSVVEGKGG